ncbi:hypothetical protein Glove_230g136 [Diversispora epigaea]|uniref:Uncharacterized protein n=1 Tax=Diversispora epigaea TaxID=1348612 RepID=A0A397IIL1_9GLOM|nr:hypothetical protein Glove_230g136 [Diversispora epigaea]
MLCVLYKLILANSCLFPSFTWKVNHGQQFGGDYNQDPVWKLSDLEELRRIHEQLKLLFQIRDNCVKIIQDLEQLQNMDQRNRINRESQYQRSYSQPEIQRPTSPRIRPRVYQQTSNRPSLNLSLPQYTTPLTIRSGNLSPVEFFQRDYLTGIDPHSSDEETTYTYQSIAGSSRPNPNQNLIDFEPEEDNPPSGSPSENSSNNSNNSEESEEEMAFVVKPPKFSGTHNEDPKE